MVGGAFLSCARDAAVDYRSAIGSLVSDAVKYKHRCIGLDHPNYLKEDDED